MLFTANCIAIWKDKMKNAGNGPFKKVSSLFLVLYPSIKRHLGRCHSATLAPTETTKKWNFKISFYSLLLNDLAFSACLSLSLTESCSPNVYSSEQFYLLNFLTSKYYIRLSIYSCVFWGLSFISLLCLFDNYQLFVILLDLLWDLFIELSYNVCWMRFSLFLFFATFCTRIFPCNSSI